MEEHEAGYREGCEAGVKGGSRGWVGWTCTGEVRGGVGEGLRSELPEVTRVASSQLRPAV